MIMCMHMVMAKATKPRSYDKNQRTERFVMLFAPGEKKALARAAGAAGIPLADFTRQAIAFAIANPHLVNVEKKS